MTVHTVLGFTDTVTFFYAITRIGRKKVYDLTLIIELAVVTIQSLRALPTFVV